VDMGAHIICQLVLESGSPGFVAIKVGAGDCKSDAICPYVPVDRLVEFYDKLWTEILPKYRIGRLPSGESCGFDCGRYEMGYATLSIPDDAKGLKDYEKAKTEVAELITSLGGSIAACMGVGLKQRDNLRLEFSPVALDVMRMIKSVLDPDNIMNPGKKIPD